VAAGAIDERIQQLVAARREDLAELVRQAVERELQALVAAELEARNGNGTGEVAALSGRVRESDAVKVCTGPCGRTLPVTAFERGRRKCRECRRGEYRNRERRAPDPEPPRTGPSDERDDVSPLGR